MHYTSLHWLMTVPVEPGLIALIHPDYLQFRLPCLLLWSPPISFSLLFVFKRTLRLCISDALNQHGNALTAANAGSGDAVTTLQYLQRPCQGAGQTNTGCTQRVSDSQSTAMYV